MIAFKKIMPVMPFFAGWMTLAAMPPWNIWLAGGIGLSVFLLLLNSTTSKKHSFMCGWLFAMGYFLPGLAWIGNALLVEGNDFKWVWPLAIAGLPVLLSLFYGYAAVLFFIFKKRNAANWILFIVLISLTEWVRGHIFTGFPWNLFGYSWGAVPEIMQISSLGGIYLLSLMTIAWFSMPAACLNGRHNKKYLGFIICAGLLSAVASYAYGYNRINSKVLTANPDDQVMLVLVQPNIAQEDKWNPEKLSQNLNLLFSLSENTGFQDNTPALIIWPETAITERVFQQPLVKLRIAEIMSGYPDNSRLITGFLRSQSDENDILRYYNSIAIIDKNADIIQIYDKTHLVPFGEYIPFKDYIPFDPFAFYGGFTKGSGSYPINIIPGVTINPLICYEIVFPSQTHNVTPGSAMNAIINVTNDAWYGDSSGPRQHFEMARYRAIEQGVPVIRAANTGISGVIDPYGKVIKNIPLMTGQARRIPMPQPLTRNTLYNETGELYYFLIVCSLLILLYLCASSQNRRKI